VGIYYGVLCCSNYNLRILGALIACVDEVVVGDVLIGTTLCGIVAIPELHHHNTTTTTTTITITINGVMVSIAMACHNPLPSSTS